MATRKFLVLELRVQILLPVLNYRKEKRHHLSSTFKTGGGERTAQDANPGFPSPT